MSAAFQARAFRDLTGAVTVVTGASAGIGYVIARELARAGADTVLVSRSAERTQAAATRIADETGADPARLHVLPCDFESLACVRDVAARIAGTWPRVDVLVNNAGGIFREREVTVDGHEATWQVNHLAPFLLTNLLKPQLATAPAARVVVVSSDSHLQAARGIRFDDLELERAWSPFSAYAHSKLANIMFAYELARRWSETRVASNAVHPGVVRTGFGREGWGFFGVVWRAFDRFYLTPDKGADTPLWVATSTELEGRSGGYYYKRQPHRSSPASYDEQAWSRLWERSAEAVGL